MGQLLRPRPCSSPLGSGRVNLGRCSVPSGRETGVEAWSCLPLGTRSWCLECPTPAAGEGTQELPPHRLAPPSRQQLRASSPHTKRRSAHGGFRRPCCSSPHAQPGSSVTPTPIRPRVGLLLLFVMLGLCSDPREAACVSGERVLPSSGPCCWRVASG